MKKPLTILWLLVGDLSMMAQSGVYSSNIVGYATVSIPPGYSLLANPLSAGITNGANEIMPVLDGEAILTWNGLFFNEVMYDSGVGGWVQADDITPALPPSLPPGEGFFFFNPNPTATNFTFVGQVVPGPSSTNYLRIQGGYSLIGSPLPATVAEITNTPVNLPILDGMQILKWSGSAYVETMYDSGASPTPGWVKADDTTPTTAPAYDIGEGFFFFNPSSNPAIWYQSLP
jgi:hypothetical protein